MSGVLDGRIALVSGGAAGMGLGITKELIGAGAKVVVADLNRGFLDASSLPQGAHAFVEADMITVAGVDAAITHAELTFGPLDIMVCNVGGPGNCLGPVHETDPDAFDHALRLLMTSGFLGIRAAGRHMLAHHKQGAIVTIASVAGELGGPGPSVYGAGKAGLIQLTLNAAADLAPHGIRVNCISPGVALTEMLRATGKDEAFAEKLQPLPIAGLPERIGAAVVFLCSGAASVVAGANLRVDGAALAAGIDLRQKLGF